MNARRTARIAVAAALVAGAALPAAPASASQHQTGVRALEKACATSKGRPIARMALNTPEAKRAGKRRCKSRSRKSRRTVKAHIAPHFRGLAVRLHEDSRPVARAAR